MWSTILNIVLLGLPYLWKFIKTRYGNKIDDKVEDVIDDVVEAVTDKDETTEIIKKD